MLSTFGILNLRAMDQTPVTEDQAIPVNFNSSSHKLTHFLKIVGAILAVASGITLGYLVIAKQAPTNVTTSNLDTKIAGGPSVLPEPAKTLAPDALRDTATGKIEKKPASQQAKQGTHILRRDDAPWPIYLVSSHVDLTSYEGKHVKVYGATYNGGTNDWYLEVNKVEDK